MNKIFKNSILISGLTLGLILFTGNDNIERIKDKVSSMTNKIITMSQDRDKIVEKLQSTIDKYNTDIESLNQEKSNLEKELSNLNEQLENEHENTSSLIQEKTELQNTINNLNTQISEHNNTITTLRDELTRSNGEVEKANKAVEELEEFVNGKFDEVKDIKEITDLSQIIPSDPDTNQNDVWVVNNFNRAFDCGDSIFANYVPSDRNFQFSIRNPLANSNLLKIKVTFTDKSFEEFYMAEKNFVNLNNKTVNEIKITGSFKLGENTVNINKVIKVKMEL